MFKFILSDKLLTSNEIITIFKLRQVLSTRIKTLNIKKRLIPDF